MDFIAGSADVIVIGAGHAGCEASLACARLGLKTLLFAISLESIAQMSCNPNIGGTAKGHLVREIDALGGEMGKNIDKTYIQSKMLNESKGPAVHSLRAQADKKKYAIEMKRTLEHTPNLTLKQAEIKEILVESGKVKGVRTTGDTVYHAKAVILASGTYLDARCITGDHVSVSGPSGLLPASDLSSCLLKLGFKLKRYKTGTPSRIDGRTVDYAKVEPQYGDEHIVPFSFTNTEEEIKREQVKCFLTYTNERTHQIILENIDRSPLYNGSITGVGPRYCPSIETKVLNFRDKERHQIFLEPEGEDTNEIYVQGMSSSLHEDVQIAMLRTVSGLEHCEITRVGYAIEYDALESNELTATLETKKVAGLFSAGQVNGSSGYEEAAAQGLMAGVNASMKVLGRKPVILDRSEAYIGVLIDDLVTKESHEPYRMMTSRAEYRLVLRQDNADLRLTELGHTIGLIDEERYKVFLKKREQIVAEILRLKQTNIGTKEKVQEFLKKYNSTELLSGVTLENLIKRPELDYEKTGEIDEERPGELSDAVRLEVNILIKYEGYIKNQEEQIAQFKKLEKRLLPDDIVYKDVSSIRIEAVQKLGEIRPLSIGQASRISGVSPSDITALLVHLEKRKRSVGKDV